LRERKKEKSLRYYCRTKKRKIYDNWKSIFTLEILEWINKVRVGTVPTLYYTKGEALRQSMKELR
jgi:hypothetical protein